MIQIFNLRIKTLDFYEIVSYYKIVNSVPSGFNCHSIVAFFYAKTTARTKLWFSDLLIIPANRYWN